MISMFVRFLNSNCLMEYRPAHSTETALVRVNDDLLCAVDKQQAVILTILDLSAAFDTVDRNILLQRLQEEVLVGSHCSGSIESYLPGRKTITINKTSSSECDLIYGVRCTSRVCVWSDYVRGSSSWVKFWTSVQMKYKIVKYLFLSTMF